ncbi:MAG: GNAT family N-acetyltransferase [Cyanobacteria bacterium J06641_5]
MTPSIPDPTTCSIRVLQYRDLEAIAALAAEVSALESDCCVTGHLESRLPELRRWSGALQVLSVLPDSARQHLGVYVAECDRQIVGAIAVEPTNTPRTTWRVQQVLAAHSATLSAQEIGSQLLRHCLEKIWEARTWMVEANVHHQQLQGLYRRGGFQPLAQFTYWDIDIKSLQQLAERDPQLPNLHPASSNEARLLYQLDTVSMPPLLRQVFDRHVDDFKLSFWRSLRESCDRWFGPTNCIRAYVFEPQRKAAIGYFCLQIARHGQSPHQAHLVVHPAYTWLYPELFAQMARAVWGFPAQSLQLRSADYQPEREEYLERIGAEPMERTLLMSRSVWHKLREAKPLERLQLSGVLQSLQPNRPPIPSRFSAIESTATQPDPSDSPESPKRPG